ncbi:hypothetical protein COO60DRAFT_1175858 [Scenedesmus sp. NREL 46B-D3]|nr:hypothetical protein COO60DRAFT_1175858 [Scenedesmus sp. NREL 46B-D3]
MMTSRLAPVHRHGALNQSSRLHGRYPFSIARTPAYLQLQLNAGALSQQLEPQQQQQLPAIPLCLNGRAVAILWDLDNVAPSSLQLDLIPAARELQVLLTRLGGRISHTALYANPATCARLGDSLKQQLAAAAVQLVQVQLRKQAADMRLAADAYAFARQQQQRGCIVCVSSDTDFAPVLSYAAGQGAVTINMSAVTSPKRLPGLLPDLKQQPLPEACHAVLAWQPAAGSAARKRNKQQRQQLPTDTKLQASSCNSSKRSSSSSSTTAGLRAKQRSKGS